MKLELHRCFHTCYGCTTCLRRYCSQTTWPHRGHGNFMRCRIANSGISWHVEITCRKQERHQCRKDEERIHVKACSLKDAFSDNKGHARWTVNHRNLGLQARKHVPVLHSEDYSTMQDGRIIVSLLITFSYFIENTPQPPKIPVLLLSEHYTLL